MPVQSGAVAPISSWPRSQKKQGRERSEAFAASNVDYRSFIALLVRLSVAAADVDLQVACRDRRGIGRAISNLQQDSAGP